MDNRPTVDWKRRPRCGGVGCHGESDHLTNHLTGARPECSECEATGDWLCFCSKHFLRDYPLVMKCLQEIRTCHLHVFVGRGLGKKWSEFCATMSFKNPTFKKYALMSGAVVKKKMLALINEVVQAHAGRSLPHPSACVSFSICLRLPASLSHLRLYLMHLTCVSLLYLSPFPYQNAAARRLLRRTRSCALRWTKRLEKCRPGRDSSRSRTRRRRAGRRHSRRT
jgi:hypothetical protein